MISNPLDYLSMIFTFFLVPKNLNIFEIKNKRKELFDSSYFLSSQIFLFCLFGRWRRTPPIFNRDLESQRLNCFPCTVTTCPTVGLQQLDSNQPNRKKYFFSFFSQITQQSILKDIFTKLFFTVYCLLSTVNCLLSTVH